MTMRVSTSQIYSSSLQRMTQLNGDLTQLQTQISTGKKVDSAADDPAGYLRLQGLNRADSDSSAYGANINLAQSIVSQGDTALASIQTALQQAQELATQAANGTLSDSDRAAMANQLDSIRDSLYSLANTKDVRGQPLFGGASGDTAYTKAADGTIQYAGTGTPPAIPIGDGDSVQTSVSGTQVFDAGNGQDMFALLGSLSTALRAGGSGAAQAASDALTGLTTAQDNVTAGRASLGARGARLKLSEQQLTDAGTARTAERSSIQDTDITTAVTELQKTMTVLQATQSTFTKLTSLSLFDYIK